MRWLESEPSAEELVDKVVHAFQGVVDRGLCDRSGGNDGAAADGKDSLEEGGLNLCQCLSEHGLEHGRLGFLVGLDLGDGREDLVTAVVVAALVGLWLVPCKVGSVAGAGKGHALHRGE